MSRWSPISLTWILGHLLLLLLGIIILQVPPHSAPISSALLDSVGGSFVAAGITGEVLYIYVAASESMRARLELFTVAGLLKIFPVRSVRIREEYDARISSAREIDVIGFGLSSFREDYGHKFRELASQATIRILLLDPDFPTKNSSIAHLRDQEENNDPGQIRRDVEAFEATVQNIDGLDRTRFKIRRLKAIPSINLFRVDDVIFWGPYLVGQQSRNMPTLLVQRGGFLFEKFKQHFDDLWNSDRFSRDPN